jgi:hypothetical protein
MIHDNDGDQLPQKRNASQEDNQSTEQVDASNKKKREVKLNDKEEMK